MASPPPCAARSPSPAGGSCSPNFHDYRPLRINEAPAIQTIILASDEAPGGIGEPPCAAIAPAVTNAIFAATGKRLRDLPIEGRMGKSEAAVDRVESDCGGAETQRRQRFAAVASDLPGI